MYRVTCNSCGRPYDPTKADECRCLQPVRSFLCPQCGACFCDDPKKLDDFWVGAPPELWQKRRARTPPSTPALPSPESIQRPMVLFADDDPVGRAIALQVIESLGFGVIVAEDGAKALTLARGYQPELIITDALMPKLDGRDLSRIVKAEFPRTRIVVITSVYKDSRYKYEAMKDFHVDEYVRKPVRLSDLSDIVRKHLKSY